MKPEVRQQLIGGIVKALLAYVVFGAILFLGSGRIDWWMAWVFLGLLVLSLVLSYAFLDPGLIAERTSLRKGVKKWDYFLVGIIQVGWLAVLVTAALDSRFGWSPPIPIGVELLGALLFAAGSALMFWAMAANPFFSSLVRIQKDRGQVVATSGPYRFLRHPGYLSGIFTYFGIPLMLGSLWALIVSFIVLIDFIVRTLLEDRVLRQELEGYADYAKKVKHRLIPGVW